MQNLKRRFRLNSAFCFILRYPYSSQNDDGSKGKVYVWLGGKSDPYYHAVAKEVATELINHDDEFPVEVLKEGERTTPISCTEQY